jgi:hypothetical protein
MKTQTRNRPAPCVLGPRLRRSLTLRRLGSSPYEHCEFQHTSAHSSRTGGLPRASAAGDKAKHGTATCLIIRGHPPHRKTTSAAGY